MQRTRFVLLRLLALMLGTLISLVDSSPGWDDTGVSAAMVLTASGLLGALHPERAWVWALAVGSWIPLLGIALGHGYESVLALAFALAGAYIRGFRRAVFGGSRQRCLGASLIHRNEQEGVFRSGD
jgi:hypothetical protein